LSHRSGDLSVGTGMGHVGATVPRKPSPLILAPHEGKMKIRLERWKGKVLVVLGGPFVSVNIRPSGGGERAGESWTTKKDDQSRGEGGTCSFFLSSRD
jgi:hypothetical protein